MEPFVIFLLLIIAFMILLVILCSYFVNNEESQGTRKIKFRTKRFRPKRFGHRGRKLRSNNCDIGNLFPLEYLWKKKIFRKIKWI